MTAQNFDLSALKQALLKPRNTAIETELFGAKVYLRRRTAGELIDYEEALDKAQLEDDVRRSSEMSVQLIIDSLVNPDGSAILPEFLPTAAELIAAHDNPTLIDAIGKVKAHAIGRLDEAEKNLPAHPGSS
ncbi:phage tail protein [Erwinia typographi]|uniref:Phage tail protein n=1 Tax=Erwinia typographi TaxID=371042 RepID=A0A0A3YLM6_9GAMM|nr:phage tail protein [Erwinia typographi]KGT86251.1 phage tail protein [Erwinia typographi]